MPLTCLSEEQLHAFQVGDLPEAALNDVAAHLENCPRCETLAQKLDTALDSILSAIRDPSGLANGAGGGGPPLTKEYPGLRSAKPLAEEEDYPIFLPAEQPDELGRLGDYRILRPLGKGGMGFVFLAEDVCLRRQVALKVMRAHLSRDAENCERFFREARILASIKHVNLVTVFQAGQEGATVYLAMDLLEGESLDQRIQRTRTIPLDEILRLAREIARGLAAIHRHGLVHRDIKPSNIWLQHIVEDGPPAAAPQAPRSILGRVKILDFGLARFVKEGGLTHPGTILGTPSFMSPEQARGSVVDARSDLFSMGCVLYWLLTGVKPFGSENMMTVLMELATRDPRPVGELNPTISQELADLVMQLLAKSPADRPASAEAVLQQLRMMRGDSTVAPPPALPQPVTRRWRPAVPLALGLVVLLGIAAWAVVAFLPGRRGPIETAAAESGPVYLNSLAVMDTERWPFLGVIPRPDTPEDLPDWPAPLGGRRVWSDGRPSPHGVWMHLPHEAPQTTSVSFRLENKFRTFNAAVSLGDGPPQCIPLSFAVYGDGRLLWRSEPLRSREDRQDCTNLSVAGVNRLTLEVSGNGDARGAHAVWIEPTLTCASP